MLDRYDLGDELGTAARSAFFAAREWTTGRTVAVKLPASDPDDGAGRLELPPHPNISLAYARGERRGVRYTVTEFVHGADLGACTAPSGRLPVATLLRIAEQVAYALDHAHRHGVVHGDVKPSNIFYDAASGRVELGDFPASAREAASRGTPAYLSPQRLCAMPPSPHCDQFALGVSLYRLACGRLPVARASRVETAYAVVHEPHRFVRELAPDASASLSALLDRALAKQVQARYASCRDFGLALRRLRFRVSRGTTA
jgi:serine/threonine-protein kinase